MKRRQRATLPQFGQQSGQGMYPEGDGLGREMVATSAAGGTGGRMENKKEEGLVEVGFDEVKLPPRAHGV